MSELLGNLQNSGLLISASIFVASVALFLFAYVLVTPAIETRRRMTETLLADGITSRRSLQAQTELVRIAAQRPVGWKGPRCCQRGWRGPLDPPYGYVW